MIISPPPALFVIKFKTLTPGLKKLLKAKARAVDPHSFLRIRIQLFFSMWIRIQLLSQYVSGSVSSLKNCGVTFKLCKKITGTGTARYLMKIEKYWYAVVKK